MSDKTIQLSAIRLDGGTQCRASLDAEYIATLAEAWTDGAKIPAVVVFNDGTNNWLADGFHRYHAAQKCDYRDILAEVRSGTRTDAVRFALGANAAHGMRRTNADKRRAVEIALKEFPKLSGREVASVCAVSPDFANRLKAELSSDDSSEARLGADGKIRKMPTMRHEPRSETERAPAKEERPSIGGSIEDIEQTARESSRVKPQPITPPTNGLMYARIAIAQLEKIEPNDKEKAAAFELVRNYLVKNGG